jgi:hypothetical protein
MQPASTRVYGVDFSGARDAGRKAWVASGTIVGDSLNIEDCCSVAELPGSEAHRDKCLAALRQFIAVSGSCVFGLDFPFGLPLESVAETTWTEFISKFGDHYTGPEQFRNLCAAASCGKEPKRQTDKESRTPFSPFNLRLYRQTYFGINDLLAPLLRGNQARVLPMQHETRGLPSLIEICPASTLRRQGLSRPPYAPYKGKTEEQREARGCILKVLEAKHGVRIATSRLRSRILDNRGGDALDSIIAALATFQASKKAFRLSGGKGDDYLVEGYVYA